MTIELKFNLRQDVFVLHENRVNQVTVIAIVPGPIGLEKSAEHEYAFNLTSVGRRRESQVFATKQELLDSL